MFRSFIGKWREDKKRQKAWQTIDKTCSLRRALRLTGPTSVLLVGQACLESDSGSAADGRYCSQKNFNGTFHALKVVHTDAAMTNSAEVPFNARSVNRAS